jgi:hypothetical protein
VTLAVLKKALQAEGLEIYRTRENEVVLAERVRENLILDSGVRVRAGSPAEVFVVFRAERHDFPGEADHAVFDHAAGLGSAATEAGFAELARNAVPMTDPGDPERVLDTFYEVTFRAAAADYADAVRLARFALGLERTATAPG